MLLHKPAIHAIYVLCFLSRQKPSSVVSAAHVAEAMQVPPEQAAKLLQVLQNIGLVQAVRGRTGGYKLARDPREINVLEVIDAVAVGDEEDRLIPRGCPGTTGRICRAHHGMAALTARVRALLATVPLTEVIGEACDDAPAADAAAAS